MREQLRACWRWIRRPEISAGKITLVTVITTAIISTTTLFAYFDLFVPIVSASNVTTSVTVLNTPPSWTVNAHESSESSTSTPTNAGTTLSFKATATDSGSDNYWLIICSGNATPTPHVSAAPTCGSGIQWAVSAQTSSGNEATASTSTLDAFPFLNESNDWYGWVCDGNTTGPQCNFVYTQGDTGFPTGNSPFVINHAPYFFAVSNLGNMNPGQDQTWTAIATDTDVIRGGEQLKLMVCKSNDGGAGKCGAGGTWASSTPAVGGNTFATTTTIAIPTQDKLYNAYVYISDQNTLDARAGTTTTQGSNSSFTVNNVAPTISASTVSLVNPQTSTTTGEIILTRAFATSGPFQVKFQVTDNNSCLNSSSGNEITSATTSVYRSSVGSPSCQVTGNFDTNSCYPSVNSQTQISCTQDTGSCSGASDTTSTWTCTFNLWYNADPTDTGSFYASDNWLADVQVADDNGLLSAATTSSTGTEVDSLLAFSVSTTSIAYGGLQPGQNTSPFVQTSNLLEYGNVGLDESLYGDTMCIGWTAADSCDAGGINPASEIPVGNQQVATSSLNYSATGTYTLTSSSSPLAFGIHVQKTTATSSPQTKDTYWGIQIPGAINVSGNYSGQNTILGVRSNPSFW